MPRAAKPENEHVQRLLPLKPAEFHILLALSDRERHGYALTREIRVRSEGRVSPQPANLYRRLRQLLSEGLVAESTRRPAPDADDERRRYYRITPLGTRVLTAEAMRMRGLVEEAAARKLIPDEGGAR